MSEESTLSLGDKLSPEVQNKLRQLAGTPGTTKSELPKVDNTNVKAGNNNTNKPHKPKLNQNESEKNSKQLNCINNRKSRLLLFTNSISLILVNYIQIVLMKHPSLLPSVLIGQ